MQIGINMILFSFIIPVYNCQNYLKICVESLLKLSTFTSAEYEIILIDDGSKDQSGVIAESLVCSYPGIVKCFHQQNQGVSAARNRGMDFSSGKYVIFIDADDEIIPQKMAALMDVLSEDQDIDMIVYGLIYQTFNGGNVVSTYHLSPPLNGNYKKGQWENYLLELYQANSLSAIWSRIMKRSIIMDNHLRFREDMISFEDLEFNLRVMACCKTIRFVPDLIYHYKVQLDDGKYQRRMDRIISISDVTDKVESSLHGIKKDNQTDEILLNLYALLLKDKQVGKDKKYVSKLHESFRRWIDTHHMQAVVRKYRTLWLIYKKQYGLLKIRNIYLSFRHLLAQKIKYRIGYVGKKM